MPTYRFNLNELLGQPINAPNPFENSTQFTITGPTLTAAQAQIIATQQAKSGGLTGFKRGDALSALTQAADGLFGAQSQLPPLPGGLSRLGTTEAKSVVGLAAAVIGTPTPNAITVADFAKSVPGLGKINDVSTDQVTGVLASASKLIDQPPTLLSNAKALGKFAMDPAQLEAQGYLKPGTVAKYVAPGTNLLTSVMGTSNVWTGKDGIKQPQDLLTNTVAQTKIQQSLMENSVPSLKQFGIPMDKLGPGLQAAMSLVASRNVNTAVKWAAGNTADVPTSAILFLNQLAKQASYAVDYVDQKIGLETLGIKAADGNSNTVDRTTLDAAVSRVLGNPKIPPLTYAGSFIDTALENSLKALRDLSVKVENKTNTILAEAITSQTVDAREARIRAVKFEAEELLTQLRAVRTSAAPFAARSPAFITKVDNAITTLTVLIETIDADLALIAQFRQGIQSI